MVYMVDLLSRSLLDFAQMMETCDMFQASFFSKTQQFNIATSIGQLVLHVLLCLSRKSSSRSSSNGRGTKIAPLRRKRK